MSNDQAYESLRSQVRDLQFKMHDALDDPNHPTARRLKDDVQRLEDELQVRKNPRDIENRIKSIQESLHEAAHNDNSYMSLDDAEHFHHTYEDMRRNVRDFHDYS